MLCWFVFHSQTTTTKLHWEIICSKVTDKACSLVQEKNALRILLIFPFKFLLFQNNRKVGLSYQQSNMNSDSVSYFFYLGFITCCVDDCRLSHTYCKPSTIAPKYTLLCLSHRWGQKILVNYLSFLLKNNKGQSISLPFLSVASCHLNHESFT